MKLSLIVLAGYFYLIFRGFLRPIYFALAYLWFSLLYPQAFMSHAFHAIPWTFIAMGLGIVFYVLVDQRPFPRITPVFIAAALLVVWVTITTFRAVAPEAAWIKWDWAYKSILTALMMPVFFRKRNEIEMAALAVFFALFAHVLVAGVKTALGGGGYGSLAMLIGNNTGLGESSTLAVAAIMSIPLAFYICRHSLASRVIPFPRLLSLGYALIAVAAMVGTGARTGLVALASIFVLGIRGIGRKILVCSAGLIVAALLYPYMPERWTNRMKTIETYNDEASAATRLVVWKWTLGYVAQNPLGGGFDVYLINGVGQHPDGTRYGRAFHSVYFEMLGEQGVVGFALFTIVAGGSLLGFYRISRRKNLAESERWMAPFANSLFTSTVAVLVGGAFVGIAYQPFAWAAYGLYLCLLQTRRRPSTRAYQPYPMSSQIETEPQVRLTPVVPVETV